MDLVDLVILACLVGSPGVCSERHVMVSFEGPLAGCTMQAQPFLAQWLGDHPKLRIAGWRCLRPQTEDRRS